MKVERRFNLIRNERCMNLKRRLRALEQQIKPREEPLRVVVCHPGETADLEQAECHRQILEDGRLWEVVTLNGSDEGISKEELDRFVAKFPIEPCRQRWSVPPS